MTMNSDNKQLPSWLPWVIAAGAVYFALNKQSIVEPNPVDVKSVVKATLPNIRSAYRQAFTDAAKLIEEKKITTAEQWTEFIKANAGNKQREAMDTVYRAIDELDIPAEFSGKESEIAKLNRDIAGAW